MPKLPKEQAWFRRGLRLFRVLHTPFWTSGHQVRNAGKLYSVLTTVNSVSSARQAKNGFSQLSIEHSAYDYCLLQIQRFTSHYFTLSHCASEWFQRKFVPDGPLRLGKLRLPPLPLLLVLEFYWCNRLNSLKPF